MEKIKRSVRLFFVYYGRLLLYIIGAIILLVLVIQTLNNIAIEKNAKENKITLEEKEEIILEENKKIEYISNFIECCNTGKIEEAYKMLSKASKGKYNSIETFKKDYVEDVFNIYICDYKILKKDDIYEVSLTQDMIATGRTDSIKIEKYSLEWVLEPKINIINK